MKNLPIIILVLITFLAFTITSCEKETEFQNLEEATSVKLKGPKDYIASVTNGSFKVPIPQTSHSLSSNRSATDSTIFGEIILDSEISHTEENGMTNYFYTIYSENSPVCDSFFTTMLFTVVETNSEIPYYSYITKHSIDKNWLIEKNGIVDLADYTGKITYYNTEGEQQAELVFSNSLIMSIISNNPCDGMTSNPVGGGGGTFWFGPSNGSGNSSNGVNIGSWGVATCWRVVPVYLGSEYGPVVGYKYVECGSQIDYFYIPIALTEGSIDCIGVPTLLPECFDENLDPCICAPGTEGECLTVNPTQGVGGVGGTGPHPRPHNSLLILAALSQFISLTSEIIDWVFDEDSPNNLAMTLELLEFLEEEDLPNEFAAFAFEVFLEDFSETTSLEGLIDISLDPDDAKAQMSESELEIFNSMSYLNQMRYLYSAYQAVERSKSLYPTWMEQWNGIGDAFRHAYWNALGARRLGHTLMEQLATAHDDKPPTYEYKYKEDEMDLFNNEVGRSLSNQSGKLWKAVKSSLEAGDLRYLHPRGFTINGVFNPPAANEQSELIPTNE